MLQLASLAARLAQNIPGNLRNQKSRGYINSYTQEMFRGGKALEIYRTQTRAAGMRYLILTDPDPKTGVLRAVVADAAAQTVRRVKSVPALLRSEQWQAPGRDALGLDALVCRVPALRRHRGIEIRLPSGVTAWIRWRAWSSADADVQALLSQSTQNLDIPAYEPDGDYFLAAHAAETLGGKVLDPPRSVLDLGEEAY